MFVEREYKYTPRIESAASVEARLVRAGLPLPRVVTQVYTGEGERIRRLVLPDGRVRVAQERKSYHVPTDGGPAVRTESEYELHPDVFGIHAIDALEGNVPYVVKHRYTLEHEYQVDVDIYVHPHPLVVVEVELEPGQELETSKYPLPSILPELIEVTGNPAYYAEHIARKHFERPLWARA